MCNLLNSLTEEEIKEAYNKGLITFSNLVLENEYLKLYGIAKSTCQDVPGNTLKAKCLYLYLYALATWCCDSEECNSLSEKQLFGILGKIEELQLICCKPSII